MKQAIRTEKLKNGYTSPAGLKYPEGWGLWIDDELSLVGSREEIEDMVKLFESENTTNET